MKKAVFIDKDGTLIKDIPYNVDPDLVEFENYAIEALHIFKKAGYMVVIITNQPGIAFGYFQEDDLHELHERIKDLLLKEGIALDGFYYCPHHVSGKIPAYKIACNCRKPMPGLLVRAAEEMNIDLSHSWMIGDILNDVEAGNRAGCKTILINNGNETEWEMNEFRKPDHLVAHLKEAAKIITGSRIKTLQ
jgi:D-glycero-D-manno-heptose 1,7-bisphosphate phosphatase